MLFFKWFNITGLDVHIIHDSKMLTSFFYLFKLAKTKRVKVTMLAKDGKTGSVLHSRGKSKPCDIFAGQISMYLSKLQMQFLKHASHRICKKKNIFRQKWVKPKESYPWRGTAEPKGSEQRCQK